MADIIAAAAQGNRDGVLLHFIADPASVNQRDNGYDTQPDTCTHVLMCLYCLLTLLFAVAEPRCMCLLLQVTWKFASFSLKREQTCMQKIQSSATPALHIIHS